MLADDGELEYIRFFSYSDSRNYIVGTELFCTEFGWTVSEVMAMVKPTAKQEVLELMRSRTSHLAGSVRSIAQ